MIETTLPPAPDLSAPVSAPVPAPLLEQLATLRLENAALREDNAALQERIRELEARLDQDSSNSSRPPSSDPPQPQAPRQRQTLRSGRKRGGQPGHRGAFRALLPVEQVDEIVAVVPEVCRHCGQPFPEVTRRRRDRVWRHQVLELLPLAVCVTEYQMGVRHCADCGQRTRADLPRGCRVDRSGRA
jgi:transposase